MNARLNQALLQGGAAVRQMNFRHTGVLSNVKETTRQGQEHNTPEEHITGQSTSHLRNWLGHDTPVFLLSATETLPDQVSGNKVF